MRTIPKIIGLSLFGAAYQGGAKILGGTARAAEEVALAATKLAAALRKEEVKALVLATGFKGLAEDAKAARQKRVAEVGAATQLFKQARQRAYVEEVGGFQTWSGKPVQDFSDTGMSREALAAMG